MNIVRGFIAGVGVALSLLTGFGIAGCAEQERPAPINREMLIEGMHSLQTGHQVMAALQSMGYQPKFIADPKGSSLTRSGSVPQFNIDEVIVDKYVIDIDARGQLRAQFFNNRLVAIWFYPELEASTESLLARIKEEHAGSTTIAVHSGTDYRNKAYVRVVQIQLWGEMQKWIEEYA